MPRIGTLQYIQCVGVYVCRRPLTLDDCQKDYNDEEEEGDVKDDAIDFVLVTCWVLNLVTNPSTCPHTYIHVKHVALGMWKDERCTGIDRNTERFKMLDLKWGPDRIITDKSHSNQIYSSFFGRATAKEV